ALSRIVRAKFRDQIDRHGLLGEVPGEVWVMEWNVNCPAAGDGGAALQYLAPYVFKVAIGEHRILSVDADHVCFRYQKPHRHRVRTMTLPIMEFMRRFLQHVLPRGFMKVRYYGFLSPSSSVPLPDVKARIELASGFVLAASEATGEPPAALRCRQCGGALRFSRLLLPGDVAIDSLASQGQRAGASSTLSVVPAGP
ncbi:MAG: transposase, partial [Tepidiformaceae bacterium]